MPNTISSYSFTMQSDPKGIDIKETINPRMLKKIYFSDSIFKFFPYGQFYLNDPTGIISDTFLFVEGMKLTCNLGADEWDDNGKKRDGYLNNTYCWSENEMNNIKMGGHLAGDNAFILLDSRVILDRPRTRAFQKPISDIAKEIAQTDLKFSSTKIKISNTKNSTKDVWYQAGRTNRQFLEVLMRSAYSADSSSSQTPFQTFINCAGEFYFMSFAEMYKEKTVATFKCSFEQDQNTNYDTIKRIKTHQGGIPINKINYKQSIYKLPQDGVLTDALESKLSEHYVKLDSKDKFLVRKEYEQINSIHDFGLFEEEIDVESFKARENFLYIDSNTAYRLDIVVRFNPKCVAGKTIEIKIPKANEDFQYAAEYSGKWLILTSEHGTDIDMMPFTRLLIARPAVAINNNWPYKADLI